MEEAPVALNSSAMATEEKHTKQRLWIPVKTRIELTIIGTVARVSRNPDGSVNRNGISRLLEFCSAADPRPRDGVSTADFTVDPSRDLWFRVFTPHSGDGQSDRRLPVVFYLHGGGFVSLSADSSVFDRFCRRFARETQACVVSVNYRLAPEHRFPDQYEDGFDALKFLDENHAKVLPGNADLTKCFLAGDSAGGNIAHNVAIRVSSAVFGAVRIAGLVAIQPFFGGEERTESELSLIWVPVASYRGLDWCWSAFLPEGSDRDHGAANVTGPNAEDISGVEYPATMVVVGGLDPLQDWQRRYSEWLKKSGKRVEIVEYPNAFHAFYLFPEVPESGEFMMRVKDFIHGPFASSLSH